MKLYEVFYPARTPTPRNLFDMFVIIPLVPPAAECHFVRMLQDCCLAASVVLSLPPTFAPPAHGYFFVIQKDLATPKLQEEKLRNLQWFPAIKKPRLSASDSWT